MDGTLCRESHQAQSIRSAGIHQPDVISNRIPNPGAIIEYLHILNNPRVVSRRENRASIMSFGSRVSWKAVSSDFDAFFD